MTAIMIGMTYWIEVAVYYVSYELFTDMKVKRYWAPLVGLVLYGALWVGGVGSDVKLIRVLVHMLCVLVAFVIPKVDIRTRITGTFILFFIVNCVSELMLTIADALLFLVGMDLADMKQLVVYTIQLLIFLSLASAKRKHAKMSQWITQKHIIYMVIGMSLAMLFTISGLNWARTQIDKPAFQFLSLVLCSASYVGVCLLALFSIYTEKVNKTMEQMVDNEKRMADMQKRYYDTLLEREADTRKYRHDMNNHLLCLEQLVKQQDFAQVESYLGNMQQRMIEIQKRCFSTGNDILDILTNHYVNLLDEQTKVVVSGMIRTGMDPMALCTIYANLLQNAVEELNRCEGESKLEVMFRQGSEYFQIRIQNTLSESSKNAMATPGFLTVKENKKAHGIGLRNVRKTVEEVGGLIDVETEKGFFTVTVVLRVDENHHSPR